ncbi:MAG: BMP family protein [Ectobacillus sp.]
MKQPLYVLFFLFAVILSLTGCAQKDSKNKDREKVTIGIMLPDIGLGDQSFSDSAFTGLEQARNELGILFDYRELADTKTYEKGLTELVEQGNDLVVGLGFAMQEDLEKVAKKFPKQKFLLIDGTSQLPNVYSVTFKEHEGSYLIGVLAGMKTKTNKVGFIGGLNVPLINKFAAGFEQGVKEVNPSAQVLIEYAGTFGDDKLGKNIAQNMIANGADFVYPAAGFTGVGSILAAQENNVYAFGVDSDQYFIAEKAVVSSMLKKIDVAMFEVAKQMVRDGKLRERNMELGIAEKGVGLAPVRVLPLSDQEQTRIAALINDISKNNKKINDK